MAKVIDKLWNWGHLERSHNNVCQMECNMSPEQFMEEYGIKNSFIVSYGGNIQPPYHELAKRFSSFKEIIWSVLGDASSPLPEARLGNTEDVVAVAKNSKNITGGVVDDFFSPKRIERFTPEVLSEMKAELNKNNLDFWCVLYKHQMEEKLIPYLDCFDGITYWVWECKDIVTLEEDLEKMFALANGKKIMLGVYLWNYCKRIDMDEALYRKQMSVYFDLLEKGKVEGIIICSGTIGDSELVTCKILKEYIAEYGDREVE